MCLSCGCGKPNEDYGDSRNITMEDLDKAAQVENLSREQTVQNIVNTVAQAQGQQSSSDQSSQAQSGPAS